MNYSIRRRALKAAGLFLASATTFAAVATTMSAPAFAASSDYRFEVVQVASAGPGRSDVTVRLVRAADGTPVRNAEISAATAVSTIAEPAGYHRFRVETATAGPQTLQVSAKVPGSVRIERTFNTSIKAMLTRNVRSLDKTAVGTVLFDAR